MDKTMKEIIHMKHRRQSQNVSCVFSFVLWNKVAINTGYLSLGLKRYLIVIVTEEFSVIVGIFETSNKSYLSLVSWGK